jgi:hypothetical protein
MNGRQSPYLLLLTALIITAQANIFVHFIPVDHDDMNTADHLAAKAKKPLSFKDRLKSVFGGLTGAKKQNIGGHEQDNHDEVSLFVRLITSTNRILR